MSKKNIFYNVSLIMLLLGVNTSFSDVYKYTLSIRNQITLPNTELHATATIDNMATDLSPSSGKLYINEGNEHDFYFSLGSPNDWGNWCSNTGGKYPAITVNLANIKNGNSSLSDPVGTIKCWCGSKSGDSNPYLHCDSNDNTGNGFKINQSTLSNTRKEFQVYYPSS